MKQIFNQILDFPQMVNQKVLNAKLNSTIDSFDSQDGIRSYVKLIYQVAALVVFLTMEWGVLNAALAHFGNPAITIIGKVGSVVTLILMAYSAFPIAHIIKSKGETLGGSHNGMIEFIFKDFVTTNIRIFGEVMAVLGIIYSINLSLCFLLDSDLLLSSSSDPILEILGSLYTFPINTLSNILVSLRLDVIANALQSFTAFKLTATQSFGNDFIWYASDIVIVASSFVNVIAGLAVLYVSLSVYNYMYSLVSTLANFIPKLAFPLAIRNRNEN